MKGNPLNPNSKFFQGLESMEMDNRIRPLLNRYANFDFRIDTDPWKVVFTQEFRVRKINGTKSDTDRPDAGHGEIEDEYETCREEAIKISHSEENTFIWCFFLAILQLTLDDDGNGPYNWVKYIYVDDPVSSLDEHNAIMVANHLAQMLKGSDKKPKIVISTHHALFFNVLCNELRNEQRRNQAEYYFLSRDETPERYLLQKIGDMPFFHHVAALVDLCAAARDDSLCTYHFNVLRTILEKTASFHGYNRFSECIKHDAESEDSISHARLINALNHGNHSLFEPQEMLEENKQHFRNILEVFMHRYAFNPALFQSETTAAVDDTT